MYRVAFVSLTLLSSIAWLSQGVDLESATQISEQYEEPGSFMADFAQESSAVDLMEGTSNLVEVETQPPPPSFADIAKKGANKPQPKPAPKPPAPKLKNSDINGHGLTSDDIIQRIQAAPKGRITIDLGTSGQGKKHSLYTSLPPKLDKLKDSKAITGYKGPVIVKKYSETNPRFYQVWK